MIVADFGRPALQNFETREQLARTYADRHNRRCAFPWNTTTTAAVLTKCVTRLEPTHAYLGYGVYLPRWTWHIADFGYVSLLQQAEVLSEAENVPSVTRRNAIVYRIRAVFIGANGAEYRLAFERIGQRPDVPDIGTFEELLDLKFQTGGSGVSHATSCLGRKFNRYTIMWQSKLYERGAAEYWRLTHDLHNVPLVLQLGHITLPLGPVGVVFMATMMPLVGVGVSHDDTEFPCLFTAALQHEGVNP